MLAGNLQKDSLHVHTRMARAFRLCQGEINTAIVFETHLLDAPANKRGKREEVEAHSRWSLASNEEAIVSCLWVFFLKLRNFGLPIPEENLR